MTTPTIRIQVAGYRLTARLETGAAPLLPLRARLVQARWSGESAWIPLGGLDLHLGHENATSRPAPGQLLLHPGGPGSLSETEILLPYGATLFASRAGQLAGNHFATVDEGREHLAELGRRVLWDGAQDITFEAG